MDKVYEQQFKRSREDANKCWWEREQLGEFGSFTVMLGVSPPGLDKNI